MPNKQAGRPQPRRSELHHHGITTLLRLGNAVVVPIPVHLVRELGLTPGDLVSFQDVGQQRLLLRKAAVTVYGSDDVDPD